MPCAAIPLTNKSVSGSPFSSVCAPLLVYVARIYFYLSSHEERSNAACASMWPLLVSASAALLAPMATIPGATPTATMSGATIFASRPSRRAVAPAMGLDEAEIGDTWFTAFDDKDEDLDVEGLLADDLVGDDLKRIFNVNGEAGEFAPDELDELVVRHAAHLILPRSCLLLPA